MTAILSILLLLAFIPFAIFWGLWLFFTLLALLPARRITPGRGHDPIQLDIVIPAHNEELLIPKLLDSVADQSAAGKARLGTILVIADHCTDATAHIARAAGVTVLERNTGPRGKPSALQDGLAHLKSIRHSAHAVVILDADCTVSPNLLEQLAQSLDSGAEAAQAAYLLTQSSVLSTQYSPSLLAFNLKNLIRPRGMSRLHIPSQLFGTGMAFRASLLHSVSFTNHLTEDLALSHDLLLRNTPPVFVPDALVYSPLPDNTAAMSTQKIRWEAGQFQTWKTLPPLLFKLLAKARFRSTLALLDWSAPPLSLALFTWMLLTILTAALVFTHFLPPIILLAPAVTLSFLFLYLVIGILQLAPPSALLHLALTIPKFLLWKISLYARIFTGHSPKSWQRTPRTPASQVHP